MVMPLISGNGAGSFHRRMILWCCIARSAILRRRSRPRRRKVEARQVRACCPSTRRQASELCSSGFRQQRDREVDEGAHLGGPQLARWKERVQGKKLAGPVGEQVDQSG